MYHISKRQTCDTSYCTLCRKILVYSQVHVLGGILVISVKSIYIYVCVCVCVCVCAHIYCNQKAELHSYSTNGKTRHDLTFRILKYSFIYLFVVFHSFHGMKSIHVIQKFVLH